MTPLRASFCLFKENLSLFSREYYFASYINILQGSVYKDFYNDSNNTYKRLSHQRNL